ncbi:MAG TPA: energy transducer TonB [Pyrinomonadaceae bacterium]
MKFRLVLVILFVTLCAARAGASEARPLTLAVLDMGGSPTAERVAERLSKVVGSIVRTDGRVTLLDRGMSRAAARGVGYAGSLNMTLAEARALGAAVGCDFFITGDAQTLRRSSSTRPVYYESYATLFFVSAQTGRLAFWLRPTAEADTAESAETALLDKFTATVFGPYVGIVAETAEREERERFSSDEGAGAAVIDLSTDEGAASNKDLREPAPYRRLRPAYTDAAARAEAEATVDAVVEIGADGVVADVRVVRWAGFDLDQEVVATVKRMHFRPAQRDGEPVAVRVLLRYNFRKPPKS